MLHRSFSSPVRLFTLAMLAAAALSACGGGSADDATATADSVGGAGAGTSSSSSSSDSTMSIEAASRTATAVATVTLGNLPAATTTATTASISYTKTGSGTVYCRRDGYLPVACSNPFVLGSATPLATGSHTVDYYVDSGSGIDASKPAASYSWTIAALTLGNLPATTTTATNASITYANSSGTVYCRRDAFQPVACPNPFVLGSATPLAAGAHTVDFYLDSGAGIDATKPTTSYTWTVANATPAAVTTAPVVTPTPTTPVVTTPAATAPVVTTPAATAPVVTTPTSSAPPVTTLATLAKVNWEGVNYDGSYSGAPIKGPDGIVRVQTNADGTTLQRAVAGDVGLNGLEGARSEFNWYGQYLTQGVDYWYAFAIKPLEYDPAGRQIVFQLQMSGGPGGCAGPSIEFQQAGGVYVVNKNVGVSTNACSTIASNLGAVTVGQWQKFVVHVRLGYQASQSPILEVWLNGAKVLTHTDITSSPNTNNYPKIGIYKWDNAWGSVNSRASSFTPLYFGQGVDLKASADAAIAAY